MTYYKDSVNNCFIHPKNRKPRERDEETYACYELLKRGQRVPLFEKFL